MTHVIDEFTTRREDGVYIHTPLSNMSLSTIELHGLRWASVEHYYQAMKAILPEEREAIRLAPTPGQAKKLGRRCQLRPNWEEIKIQVMRTGLRAKFVPSNADGRYLISTGQALLIEGNTWGDKFWGCVGGIGENWLGHLLMARRAEVRYLEITR